MQQNHMPDIFPYFIAVWAALGLGTLAFLHFNRNAALKRRVWPLISLGSSVLFLGFAWQMGFKGEMLFVAVPMVVLITLLNIRNTRFCDACGSTLHKQVISRDKFCPKCGAALR